MRKQNTCPIRSLRSKRAAITNRLYKFEEKNIETIGVLKKRRSLNSLQTIYKRLWNRYNEVLTRRMPALRFGPGCMDLGRPLSYTYGFEYIELCPGQRNLAVLIHELVHALGCTQHGKLFSARYWKILEPILRGNKQSNRVEQELLLNHPKFVRRVMKVK